jgi:hypothetical protein
MELIFAASISSNIPFIFKPYVNMEIHEIIKMLIPEKHILFIAELTNNKYVITPIKRNSTKINSNKHLFIISNKSFNNATHQTNVFGGQSYLPISLIDSHKNLLIFFIVVKYVVLEYIGIAKNECIMIYPNRKIPAIPILINVNINLNIPPIKVENGAVTKLKTLDAVSNILDGKRDINIENIIIPYNIFVNDGFAFVEPLI